jgi:hypothetical protein
MQTGTVAESTFPYTAADEPCPPAFTPIRRASGWSPVDADRFGLILSPDEIKSALCSHGPLQTQYYIPTSFYGYTGGVISEDDPAGVRTQHVLTCTCIKT